MCCNTEVLVLDLLCSVSRLRSAQSFNVNSIQIIFGYKCVWALPWRKGTPHWNSALGGSYFLPSSPHPFLFSPILLCWAAAQLTPFGERDTVVFAIGFLLCSCKMNRKRKKPGGFSSWVCELSQRSVSQVTADKWGLGGSDPGSERTRKQREKGKACDVIPGAN